MYLADQEKTAFITHMGNYCYRVMPFWLKNVGANYQRMMNKVFESQIGRMLKVYMDDMIVITKSDVDDVVDLTEVFAEVNMRLNPEICTFGIQIGKFLRFYLIAQGIKANPDKCREITEMRPCTTKKEIHKLTGMIAALSYFVSKTKNQTLPFFKLVKKGV